MRHGSEPKRHAAGRDRRAQAPSRVVLDVNCDRTHPNLRRRYLAIHGNGGRVAPKPEGGKTTVPSTMRQLKRCLSFWNTIILSGAGSVIV
jgi:hypothetical protein